jgi:3-hexulose-6-phosphate synthase
LFGENRKFLQIALDYTDIGKAVSLVKQVSDLLGQSVIIEVGTPLVKSFGVYESVSAIREAVGKEAVILVDMKTMDTGYLEAELAFSSGGNITTVLGVADDETIKEALRAASKYGGLVQVDLINHPDPIRRAEQLVEMGAHIIGLHAGIDTQRGKKLRALDLLDTIEEVKKKTVNKALVSVAGGVKPSETRILAEKGADIIVIGGAITSSPSPRESLLEALRNLDIRRSK